MTIPYGNITDFRQMFFWNPEVILEKELLACSHLVCEIKPKHSKYCLRRSSQCLKVCIENIPLEQYFSALQLSIVRLSTSRILPSSTISESRNPYVWKLPWLPQVILGCNFTTGICNMINFYQILLQWGLSATNQYSYHSTRIENYLLVSIFRSLCMYLYFFLKKITNI